MTDIDHSTDRTRAALRGYVRLRWLAFAGHVVALCATWSLGFALDLPALSAVLGVELAAGMAVAAARPSQGDRAAAWLVWLMALDVVVLIALLYLTGGPHNPMSVVVMVNIAMAAVMLPPARAWGITAFALGLSALLFVDSRPLVMRPAPDTSHVAHEAADAAHAAHGEHATHEGHAAPDAPDVANAADGSHAHGHDMNMDLHVQGMWAGYIVAGAVIVGFMLRLRRALDARDTALQRSQQAQARVAQQARLATLAAGAAHELATPLASIAIAADELAHRVDGTEASEDVEVIRGQVARCRTILERMSLGAGEAGAGTPEFVQADEVARRALRDVRGGDGVIVDDHSAGAQVCTYGDGLVQALRNVLDNAVRASPADVPARLQLGVSGDTVAFAVIDRGPGMPPDVLDHLGEPFYSTRPEGEGMGLGLFVARSVVDQLGGGLDVTSVPGEGTTVTLSVPVVRSEAA